MRAPRLLLGCGLIAGCGSSTSPCKVGPASLNGPSTRHSGPQQLQVSAPPGARLWVDGGGTDGWVDIPEDGLADVTLEDNTRHTALLEQCGAVTDSWTLTTAAPDPTSSPAPLGTAAWAADLLAPTVQFLEPPSALPISTIKDLTGESSAFLFGFDAAGQAWVGFAEVTADLAWQHACTRLAELPARLDGSALELGPATVVLTEPPDRRYDLEEVHLTATLSSAPDGSPLLHDLRLTVDVDLRTLPGGDGTRTCAQLSSYGSGCVPCADQADSDSAEHACMPLDLLWPELAPVPGLVVDPELPWEPQC